MHTLSQMVAQIYTRCAKASTCMYPNLMSKNVFVMITDFSAIQKNNWCATLSWLSTEHSFAEEDPAAIIYLTERNTIQLILFYI